MEYKEEITQEEITGEDITKDEITNVRIKEFSYKIKVMSYQHTQF